MTASNPTLIRAVRSNAEVAIAEAMDNFITVAIGENLRSKTVENICLDTGRVEDGAAIWEVIVTVTPSSTGRPITCKAAVPIAAPDAEYCITRIADRPFALEVDDYLEGSAFTAWCECNPSNGAMIIVRQVRPDRTDRWLVGGGMEEDVEYRGEFERLPKWAKLEGYKQWTEVGEVQLDFMKTYLSPPLIPTIIIVG